MNDNPNNSIIDSISKIEPLNIENAQPVNINSLFNFTNSGEDCGPGKPRCKKKDNVKQRCDTKNALNPNGSNKCYKI